MPDISPIIDLFRQMPPGTGKVILMLFFILGISFLLTFKNESESDDFLWWDDWWM